MEATGIDGGATQGKPTAVAGGDAPLESRHLALGQLLELASVSPDLGELLPSVLDTGRRLLGADLVGYWRPDGRTGDLRLEAGIGWADREIALSQNSTDAKIVLGYGLAESVAAQAGGELESHGIHSALAVAVEPQGRGTAGALGVYQRSERQFTAGDRALLETLSGLIALCQARARGVRLDQEVERAQLEAGAGALVAGVSHDFSNILSVVLSNAGLIGAESSRPGTVRELAEEISVAAQRGTDICRSLVDLSRRTGSPPVLIETGRAIEEISRILLSTMGGSVSLRLDIEAGVPSVRLQQGDLERIVVNLVLNARDALEDSGTVLVTARSLDTNGSAQVEIAVIDDGPGMDTDTASHALDPGFTTKPGGAGSGIGLTNVARIVGDAGGAIEIKSEPGLRTTVTVKLPAAHAPGAYRWQPQPD